MKVCEAIPAARVTGVPEATPLTKNCTVPPGVAVPVVAATVADTVTVWPKEMVEPAAGEVCARVRVVGARLAPVPLRFAPSCAAWAALLWNRICSARAPGAVGANDAVTLHEAPPARVAAQPLELEAATLKSPVLPVPLKIGVLKVSVAVPELDTDSV